MVEKPIHGMEKLFCQYIHEFNNLFSSLVTLFLCIYRYHFEPDNTKFFPTITFENGPVEIEVVWQNALDPHSLPSFKEVLKIFSLHRKIFSF